jgi:hypothetical protein
MCVSLDKGGETTEGTIISIAVCLYDVCARILVIYEVRRKLSFS